MPLALELPQYIHPKSLLLVSTASWIIALLRHLREAFFYSPLYRPDRLDFVKACFDAIFNGALSSAVVSLMRRLNRPSLPSLGTKLGVNLLYFAFLFYPAFSSAFAYAIRDHCINVVRGWLVSWASFTCFIVMGMFGIAALLYGSAMARRHPMVSSSLLGGTGVEAMVLTLPRWGQSHESVGDEAGEGAIRL